MKTRQRFLLSSVLACTVFWGCNDRTLDEWRRSKVDQELSKIESIAGSYKGVLYSNEGETPLGTIEVQVEPDLKLGSSSDGLMSESHANVRGKVSVKGQGKASLIFNNGSFDPNAKNLKMISTIQQRNGQNVEIDLTAVIDGARLQGRIEAFGYEESGAHFTLERDPVVELEQEQLAGSDKIGSVETLLRVYSSMVQFAGNEAPVAIDLTMLDPRLNAEQEFLNVFFPIKTVNMSLNLGENRTVYFANSQWDRRTGVLLGESQGEPSGRAKYGAVLRCQQIEQSWDCSYLHNQKGLFFRSMFSPKQDGSTVSQTESIKGLYRGLLASKATKSPLGSIELEIEPELEVDADSGLITDQPLRLRGRLLFHGRIESVFVFRGGAYDPTTGKLRLSTTVQVASGRSVDLDVSARLAGKKLTGRIEAFGQSEFGGEFVIEKDAVLPPATGENDSEDVAEVFTGKHSFGGREVETHLILMTQKSSAEQELTDFLSPVKILNVGLHIGNGALDVLFTNARLDSRSGTLMGQTKQEGGNNSYELSLTCRQKKTKEDGWNCIYSSSKVGKIFSATFAKKR